MIASFLLRPVRLLIGACLCLLQPVSVSAEISPADILYQTDFEAFTLGDGRLVGTDAWVGTATNAVNQGIDDLIEGIGKHAFIGYGRPALGVSFVSVRRPINFNPLDGGVDKKQIIEFQSLIGIADSDAGGRDSFDITVYNRSNQVLGAINFDTSTTTPGIFRFDGVAFTYVAQPVAPDVLYDLRLRINFETNRWSASFRTTSGDVPIFQHAPFNANGRSRTLGSFAAEWEIANPLLPGDNFMIFDDWIIAASSLPQPVTIARSGSSCILNWSAETGYSYRIQHTEDPASWPNTVATVFTVPDAFATSITWTDTPPATIRRRFYRVTRNLP